MPIGQQVTLDTAFGSATVVRFFRGQGSPWIEKLFDLTVLINAGQDVHVPPPYWDIEFSDGTLAQLGGDFDPADFDPTDFFAQAPSAAGPPQIISSIWVVPTPDVIVTDPSDVVRVYPGIIVGAVEDQGRNDIATGVGIIEANTLVRAIVPAADLSIGGLYSAYLHFDTVSTSFSYFFVG